MDRRSRTRRLDLALQGTSEEVHEPDAVADAPLVRFSAYGQRQRFFGWVRLRADRLTDLLNACEEVHLTDVEIESLDDGRTRSAEEIFLPRGDLVAVQATGPRGDVGRRRATRSHPIVVEAGNYLIAGHLHARPGDEPLADVRDRPTMFPLTDAWVEYWTDGERRLQSVGTVIVNRDRTDSIRLVTDEDLIEDRLRPSPLRPTARP